MTRPRQLAAALAGLVVIACNSGAEQAQLGVSAATLGAPPASLGVSAAALYNSANAYARAGKPGLAVLDYERASLLAPNDPDIEANLRFVRTSQHLPATPPTAFSRLATQVSSTVLAWVGLAGIIILGTSLIAGQLTQRQGWLRRVALGCGLALVVLTVCNGVALWPTLHDAVVLTDASPVRVSPVPMGDPLFVLPEAETVRITAEHDEFVLITTRTGKSGWMARANLAPVLPGAADQLIPAQ